MGFLLPLSVALLAIVRLAEHLTVRLVRCSASAPCGHMVGVHLGLLVNAFGICIVPDGAQRAIRGVVRLSVRCLLAIDRLNRLLMVAKEKTTAILSIVVVFCTSLILKGLLHKPNKKTRVI